MVSFVTKKFDDLSKSELLKVLKLRQEVFIVEQNCVFLDIDDADQGCTHILAIEGDRLIAYARIVSNIKSGTHLSIGRVVVARPYRGAGLGRSLMQYSLDQAQIHYPDHTIHLHAQLHLEKFYYSLGFVRCEPPYYEFGIPHIPMRWDKSLISQI